MFPWINSIQAKEKESLNIIVKKLSKIHTKLGSIDFLVGKLLFIIINHNFVHFFVADLGEVGR